MVNGYWSSISQKLSNDNYNHPRYTFSSEDKLKELCGVLDNPSSVNGSEYPGTSCIGSEVDGFAPLIQVGVHRNVGVDFCGRWTLSESPSTVQQVFCSACSCSYSGISNKVWEKFARMVLRANYEATLLAAMDHVDGNGHVFLTFIGGGVFRNDMAWIVEAIALAVINVNKIKDLKLQVHICHYREVPSQSPHPLHPLSMHVLRCSDR